MINRNTIGRLLLSVLLIAAIIMAALYRTHIDIDFLTHWIGNAGVSAAVIFTLLFAVTTVLLIPGFFFTLAGGILFGPILGTFLNLTGATMGAGIAFLIARYIAADWVAKKSHGRVKRLINGVESEGWKFVAFVRLVPIFPFFLLNYALGVTSIGFTPYLVTTFFSLVPSVAAITYLGYAGREAMGNGEAIVQKLLFALALIALSIFLPYFMKKWYAKPHNTTS